MCVQVLRKAIKVADDNGDDIPSVALRWILCWCILLGAEGPSFAVAEVRSLIKRVRVASQFPLLHSYPIYSCGVHGGRR